MGVGVSGGDRDRGGHRGGHRNRVIMASLPSSSPSSLSCKELGVRWARVSDGCQMRDRCGQMGTVTESTHCYSHDCNSWTWIWTRACKGRRCVTSTVSVSGSAKEQVPSLRGGGLWACLQVRQGAGSILELGLGLGLGLRSALGLGLGLGQGPSSILECQIDIRCIAEGCHKGAFAKELSA